MHNLAIALKEKGFTVTGSDDEIFEPSKSKLEAHGLLPTSIGWSPENITEDIDGIILGMHARKDNPELAKAQELGLKIYSFPEYIYEQSKDKQRIVIAGSHGKTTITAMVIHVLKYFNREFDYLVGAQLEGFETMVKLSDAPLIIIEGDEYLSSPIDDTPKFLKYHHHIGLISGVAWDHVNVFPTEDDYVRQFDVFADSTPKAGSLAFYEEDAMASVIGNKERPDVNRLNYTTHPFKIENGNTYLIHDGREVPVKVFGKHNMQNLSGAREVLKKIGISFDQFYEAIKTFEGASNRLEVLNEGENITVFKDYAHAPSKVSATIRAVKEQYPERKLIACLELHTFSSLNKGFIVRYAESMKYADVPVVYFNPNTIAHKKLEQLSKEDIQNAFGNGNLNVFDSTDHLNEFLKTNVSKECNLLLMSSGNFNNIDLDTLSNELIN